MSRKGKAPIKLPKGVDVTLAGDQVKVKGPKGTLEQMIDRHTTLTVADGIVNVELKPEHAEKSNFHGLMRSLVQNMVTGVTSGFEKRLEMVGVGYRAAVKGDKIDLQIGVSHPMLLEIPKGINVSVEKNSTIIITGTDRRKVGTFAALIRMKRPPEPYQGKGIRYSDEYVRRKQGKSSAK